jgi:hypothetical protein
MADKTRKERHKCDCAQNPEPEISARKCVLCMSRRSRHGHLRAVMILIVALAGKLQSTARRSANCRFLGLCNDACHRPLPSRWTRPLEEQFEKPLLYSGTCQAGSVSGRTAKPPARGTRAQTKCRTVADERQRYGRPRNQQMSALEGCIHRQRATTLNRTRRACNERHI